MRNGYDVVVVGGGHGGAQVATSLRAAGYAGSIAILEATDRQPYERPPLTKGYLVGERTFDDLLLRAPSYWAEQDVDVVCSAPVTAIDPDARTLVVGGRHEIVYGALVWAAGGHARELPVMAGRAGVHTVRTVADSDALRAAAAGGGHAVIVGGGYVGLEAAAAFRRSGLDVTVVEAQERLLARVTSAPVSAYFQRLHRTHGVELLLGTGVTALLGTQRVDGVETTDGRVLPADIVLVAVGLVPEVAVLEKAGARCGNGVDVDDAGRTSLPYVFALGDCANRVNPFAGGARVRLESVPNAVENAKAVAAAIAGTAPPVESVPWFWSHQYDARLQAAGLSLGHDRTVVRGDAASDSFTVGYFREDRLVAVDCIDNARDFAQAKFLLGKDVPLDAARFASADVPLKSLLA